MPAYNPAFLLILNIRLSLFRYSSEEKYFYGNCGQLQRCPSISCTIQNWRFR